MKKQMILTSLCLTVGTTLMFTGCQTKEEAAGTRSQQQVADTVVTEEKKTEEQVNVTPAPTPVIVPAEQTAGKPEADIDPKPVVVHPQPVIYTVSAGDSVSALSARFNVREPDILALNPDLRKNKHGLRIGQKVKFPASTDITKKAKARRTQRQCAPVAAKGGTVYTVKSGDVLGGIGARYGVKVAAIRKANNLKGDTIWVGQKLTIPGAKKPAAEKAKPQAKPAPETKPAVEATPVAPVTPVTPVADDTVPPPPVVEGEEAVGTTPVATLDATTPPPAVVAPAAPKQTTKPYVVVDGEDLIGVALKWGVSLPALREANKLDEAAGNSIAAGTTLQIPVIAE